MSALERAIDLGVNFIDTARGYGESERLAGEVVRRHLGENLYVATKVPPKNGTFPAPSGLDPAEAFPGKHIRASVEESLRASGLGAFDALQLHVWSDDWVNRGDGLETVNDLKQQGKIRAFGVSINDFEPENGLRLVGSGVVKTVQVIYNVFHQRPEESLLPACSANGVGVIVRVALDSCWGSSWSSCLRSGPCRNLRDGDRQSREHFEDSRVDGTRLRPTAVV